MKEEDRRDKMFRGVIPGISLTKEPGSYPWERPPEMEDPEQVVDFYLDRFGKKENLERAIMALELDFPLRALVEGVLTSGVSRGLHTIDVSLIVAPVIHEFLKGQADALGVEYNEGLEGDSEEMQKRYEKVALIKEMEKYKKGGLDEQAEEVSEELFVTGEEDPALVLKDEPLAEEDLPESKEEPKGLMARRGK